MKTLVVWLIVVFVLSVVPTPRAEVEVPGTDKLLHAVIYAITCALFFVVLREKRPRSPVGDLTLLAIAFSSGYGFLMEVAQTFFPPREFSLWDAAANLAGAVAGGFYVRRRSKPRRK